MVARVLILAAALVAGGADGVTVYTVKASPAFLDAGQALRRATGALRARFLGEREPEETAGEKEEEALMKEHPNMNNALNSALGAPHEGQGLETDVPLTVAEDGVEGDNALHSVRGLATGVIMPASGIFLVCIMLGNVLRISKYFKWVPESAATLFVAIILGIIMKKFIEWGYFTMHTFTVVNATVLNLFLLPIIIFNSGWSLRKGDFMSQFEYILVFAILGTLISTMFIGYGGWFMTGWVHSAIGTPALSLRESLCFAALISAVDPVATLSTFNNIGIPLSQPLLNIMIFGESAINDAVAIVLFEIFNEGWEELSYLQCLGQMAWLLFGSMIFGVLLACILMGFMRLVKLPGTTHSEKEATHEQACHISVLYIWVSAYFIFACSEACHVSGIISTLFAGMAFSVYGKKQLEKQAQTLVTEYLEICAMTADTGVFILCGTSTAMIRSTRGILFGGYSVLLCFIARALSVSSCGVVCNFMKKFEEDQPYYLSWQTLVMMWHGGLRGGIALVLALEIDGTWCEHKGMIINATFIVICTLLLVLGSTTSLMLDKLGFASDKEEAEEALVQKNRWYTKIFNMIDNRMERALVGKPALTQG